MYGVTIFIGYKMRIFLPIKNEYEKTHLMVELHVNVLHLVEKLQIYNQKLCLTNTLLSLVGSGVF